MERLDKYCYLRVDSLKNETAIVYSKDALETYETVWYLVDRQIYMSALKKLEIPTNEFVNREGRYTFYKIDSDFFRYSLNYDEGNFTMFTSILTTLDKYANEDRFYENT